MKPAKHYQRCSEHCKCQTHSSLYSSSPTVYLHALIYSHLQLASGNMSWVPYPTESCGSESTWKNHGAHGPHNYDGPSGAQKSRHVCYPTDYSFLYHFQHRFSMLRIPPSQTVVSSPRYKPVAPVRREFMVARSLS